MHPRRRFASIALAALTAAATAFAHPAIEEQIQGVSARIESSPRSGALLLQRAELYADERDFASARRDLSLALKLEPQLAAAELSLARIELRDARPREALAAADRFLAVEPHHGEGRLVRAQALASLTDPRAAEAWTEALDDLERAGRPQPQTYLDASRVLGVVAIDRGVRELGAIPTLLAAGIEIAAREGPDRAIARCRDAERLAPSPEWSVREGELLRDAGRAEDARDAFARARTQIAAMPERARGSRFVRELEMRAAR